MSAADECCMGAGRYAGQPSCSSDSDKICVGAQVKDISQLLITLAEHYNIPLGGAHPCLSSQDRQ